MKSTKKNPMKLLKDSANEALSPCPYKQEMCGQQTEHEDSNRKKQMYLMSCERCTFEVGAMLKWLQAYMKKFGDIKTVFGKPKEPAPQPPGETI